jgi:hypothetical protein
MLEDLHAALVELSDVKAELHARADRYGTVPIRIGHLWQLLGHAEAVEAVRQGMAELGVLGEPDGNGQMPFYPYRCRVWRIRPARFALEACEVRVFGVAVPASHRRRRAGTTPVAVIAASPGLAHDAPGRTSAAVRIDAGEVAHGAARARTARRRA